MQLRFLSGLAIIAVASNLVGCATVIHGPSRYVTQRQTAYVHAVEAPPLQVPPGLNGMKVGSDYAVPPLAGNDSPMPVNIVPPGLGLAPVSSAR